MLSWCSALLRACNERPFDCSADTGRCHRGRAAHWGERRFQPDPEPEQRPGPCQSGLGRRRDGFASASLPASYSTREHLLFCSRSATQRDSHPSHPLCRLQRSGDSEQTMRRDLRHGIAAPAPKQIILRTDRPPSVDRISVLPHARPGGNENGSQPTVTIADKYKSRRSHRDLRATLWRAENEAAFPSSLFHTVVPIAPS